MEPTKIDKLFALKAVKKKIDEEYKLLEGECREELLEAYGKDGTDRKTSPFFGPDAGKFSIKSTGGKDAETVREFEVADDEKLAEWLEENKGAALRYAMLNAKDFAAYWVNWSGEIPDGVEMTETHVEATPPTLTAQVYSFNPSVVLEKLGGNMFEKVNELLLDDGR